MIYPPPSGFFPVGTTLVTVFATDASGNTGTATFTVTVNQVVTRTTLTGPGDGTSTYGDQLAFTVSVASTVGAQIPDGQSVSLEDAANNNAVIGTGVIENDSATVTASKLNAGTHSIIAYYAGDPTNAASQSDAITQVINKRALLVRALTNTKSYDGTMSAAAMPTVIGLQSGDSMAGLSESYTDAGIGFGKTLVPSGSVNDGNGGNNYALSFVSNVTGVISITLNATASPTYNTQPTFSGMPSTANGDTGTVTVNIYRGSNAAGLPLETLSTTISGGTYSVKAVTALTPDGTYTAQASQAGTGGSSYTSNSVVFVIDTTPTVTAIDGGGTYNGQALSARGTAVGIGGATVSGTFTFTYTDSSGNVLASAPKDIGGYTVVASFTSSDPNYHNSQSQPVGFTITPATLTITPTTGQSMTYGSAVPVLGYTPSGFVNGDGTSLLTGLLGTTADSASPVGSYAFTLGTLAAGSNYTLTLSPSTPSLAVTPATLTITPTTGQSMPYGSAVPVLGYTLNGFVNGDSTSLLTGLLGTTADSASPVGSYPFTLGTLAAGINYTLTLSPSTPGFAVTPATLTMTPTMGQSTTYGSAVPVLIYTPSGFVNGDSTSLLTGLLGTTADSASPVGTYPFTLGTLAAGSNYTLILSSNAPTFAVTPTPLTIAPTAGQSMPYGSDVPMLSYTASGLVNGDTLSLLTGLLGTEAMSSSGVASYRFTLGSLNAGADYDLLLSATSPLFSVTPATPSFSNLSAPLIAYGTVSTTISGHLQANAGQQTVPAGETVQIIIDGLSEPATLDKNDNFSSTFGTGTLIPGSSPYTVALSYGGESNFNAVPGTSILVVYVPPVIVTNPLSQTAGNGESVTFTASARGFPAPAVQWQMSTNGVNFSNIPGANTASYTFKATTAQSHAQFRAVFTNAGGTVITKAATLTLSGIAPTVIISPANRSVAAGTNVTFTAQGSGSPMPSVQWQVSVDGGKTFSNIGGVGTTRLTFTAQPGDNEFQYRAVFSNPYGRAYTSAATLTVISAATTPPAVTTQPASPPSAVNAGQRITLQTAARGYAAVRWQMSSDGVTFTNISGATSTTYTWTAQPAENGYHYRALFINPFGQTATNAVALAVNPTITRQPAAQTVYDGQEVTFTAAATGNPQPGVQWQVSSNGKNFSNLPGANLATLRFPASLAKNSGLHYRAVFTCTTGTITTQTVTNAVVLTVRSLPAVPVLMVQPVSQTVVAGQTVTFSAAAASNPQATVQWQASPRGSGTFVTIPGATSGTLTFVASNTDNGKQYRAAFSSNGHTVFTAGAQLAIGIAPVVTLQPANKNVAIGKTVTFTAAASGSPAPTVQWQVSVDGGQTFSNIAHPTGLSLTLTAEAQQNGNFYRAVFTNAVGQATSAAAILTI